MLTIEPAPWANHVRQRVLAAAEDAGEIDVDEPVPLVVGHVVDRHATDGDRGVVDQDVDPPGAGDRCRDECRDVVVAADVAVQVARGVPGAPQRGCGGLALGVVDVGQEDLGSLSRHPVGDGATDAVGGAGDHCDLACQPGHRTSSLCPKVFAAA